MSENAKDRMMPIPPNNTDKQARWAELAAAGLRPIEIWIPDTTTPQFAAEARRQSERVAQSPDEQDVLELFDTGEILDSR
jgi:hypothetical protein